MKIAFTECLHQGKDGPLYYEASEILKSTQFLFENVLQKDGLPFAEWIGMGLRWFDLGLDDIALKRMGLPCLKIEWLRSG